MRCIEEPKSIAVLVPHVVRTTEKEISLRRPTVPSALLLSAFLACVLLAPLQATAQANRAWVRFFNGATNQNDFAANILVHPSGGVYVVGAVTIRRVTGAGSVTNDFDYAVVKYDTDGNFLWSAVHATQGVDDTTPTGGSALNAAGDVYLTGTTGPFPNTTFLTVRFGADGSLHWARTYDGGQPQDNGRDVAVDGAGNAFVTGESQGELLFGTRSLDLVTIKYDAAGNEAWVRRLDATDTGRYGTLVGLGIAVIGAGDVVVAGFVSGNASHDPDLVVVRYDADGNVVWLRYFNGPASNADEASHSSIAVDPAGDIVVAGLTFGHAPAPAGFASRYNFLIVKYDPGGNLLWQAIYDERNRNDFPLAMALDGAGNIYVSGTSQDPNLPFGRDTLSVKYDPAGNLVWARSVAERYYTFGVAADATGNAYVTGGTVFPGDLFTLAYDAAGTLLWEDRFSRRNDSGRAVATDAAGNVYVAGSSDGTFLTEFDFVTIKYAAGNQEPVARCRNVVKPAAGGCQADVSPGEVDGSSSDPDGDPLTLALVPPGPFSLGDTAVELQVDDGRGGADSCSATVTVVDAAPPAITCPADFTVECSSRAGTEVFYPQVTASDGCDPLPAVSSTPASGSLFAAGETTVHCTATDASGNSSDCSFTVRVADTRPPVIALNGPAVLVLECNVGTYTEPGAAAADACDDSVAVVVGGDAVDLSRPGTYVVTYDAADDAGNAAAQVTRTVRVVDSLAPVFTRVPADLTVECEGPGGVPRSHPAVQAFLAAAAASDACDPVVGVTHDAPESFPLGATTVTWTARDGAGNPVTAQARVRVLDTQPPALTCPAGASVAAGPGCTALVPDLRSEATALDACADTAALVITQAPAAGTLLGLGTHPIAVTATDPSGNRSTCGTTFTVADATPPVVSCPQAVEVAAGPSCQAGLPDLRGSVTASDDCTLPGALSIAQSPAAGTPVRVGQHAVTVTVSDTAGNRASCTAAVRVVDSTPPVIQLDPTSLAVVDADCSGAEVVELPVPAASDDCDPSPTVTSDAPALFPAGRTTTVTFTATDASGNSSTAALAVQVRHGATVLVNVARHLVGQGSHPGSLKVPLSSVQVCAYDKSEASCARTDCGGISHQHYACILNTCTPVGCGVTGPSGQAAIDLAPGDYVVIATDLSLAKTVLSDPLGVSASDLACGDLMVKHLQEIEMANGKKVPAKTTRRTGSELLIHEPEYIVWDGTEQLYPFVLETVGDWSVTTTVSPPEGFVADHDSLHAEVESEVESVQFTITEVGSDLVPTHTEFHVAHAGRLEVIQSQVGIYLTAEYAASRGFSVPELERAGLIADLSPEPWSPRPVFAAAAGTGEDDPDAQDLGAAEPPGDGGSAHRFRRGDANADGGLDLSDAVRILDHLFLGAPAPLCLDAADANDDGVVDMSDPVAVLTFLVRGARTLPAPSPEPGADPTADALGCGGE